jgi:hypothetical protein
MTDIDLAEVQGMLDARREDYLQQGEYLLNPYDMDSEDKLWSAWWRGHEFHRSARVCKDE